MVIIKSRTTLILLFIYLFIWLLCTACGIIVPWLGIEPWPSAVKVQSPNHWTTREFPYYNDHPINTIIFILILNHEHELDVWSKQSPWADILHLELCKNFLKNGQRTKSSQWLRSQWGGWSWPSGEEETQVVGKESLWVSGSFCFQSPGFAPRFLKTPV